jgi:hypothetical protein
MGFVPAEPIISALEVLADERRAAAAHVDEPILPQSEQDFRRRVRDLEACLHDRTTATAVTLAQVRAENAKLRRALRVLARLQPERVSRAVMEVMNDA